MTCISSYTHLIKPATKYKNVFWYSGKIRFIEPQGINGHKTCAGCPQQRYIPGEPCSVQGRDYVGIVEESSGYRARGVSIRGNSFYRETRVTRLRGPMWLNVVLTLGSLPRSQCSGTGPSASCGIVAPFAPRGFSIRGKFVLSIGQAKSSIPALSYFQAGGMKHDQELYAKVSYIPSA